MPNRSPRMLTMLRVLLPLLAAAAVLFIFYNSSKNGNVSGQMSQEITAWLSGSEEVAEDTLLEALVRKAGHIGEYALLGLLLALCARVWGLGRWGRWLAPALAGLLVGMADELYQLFIPGRTGLLSDVLIDLCGILLGTALAALVAALVRRATGKKWLGKSN